MKRMYLTVGIIALLFTWAISGLSQKNGPESHEDMIKRQMALREEIHKRIRDKLLHGMGPDDDLFKDMDSLFNDVMKDSLPNMDVLGSSLEQNFQMESIESKTGRTIVITPKSKDQRLDINVENGMISIKGQAEHKGPQGTRISKFQNSFNVPSDCDASKVKMEQRDGKILLHFPFLPEIAPNTPKKSGNGRFPLPPSAEDVQI